jgi:hypothetical protein
MITITIKALEANYGPLSNNYVDLEMQAYATKTPGLAIARPFNGFYDGKPTFGDKSWKIIHIASGMSILTVVGLPSARRAAEAFGKVMDWTQSAEELQALFKEHSAALCTIRDVGY